MEPLSIVYCIRDCSNDYLLLFSILAEKEGYSGVGLYSKVEPLSIVYGIGDKEQDSEGRTITAEYQNFYVTTACKSYVIVVRIFIILCYI